MASKPQIQEEHELEKIIRYETGNYENEFNLILYNQLLRQA